jgi:hypothetical protein
MPRTPRSRSRFLGEKKLSTGTTPVSTPRKRSTSAGRPAVVAPGAEDQDLGGRQAAGQEAEQVEGGEVGPLQVVQDQDQRPLLGGGQQHRPELVEQPEPACRPGGAGRVRRRARPGGVGGRSRSSAATSDRSTCTQGQ